VTPSSIAHAPRHGAELIWRNPYPDPLSRKGTAKKMLDFKDLAPTITRQRLVVEGYPTFVITDEHIKDYLKKLSAVTDMVTIIDPVTHVSEMYGWAGWIHWETSGAHFYSWERPISFFSVDIYTCKSFDPQTVLAFTQDYFKTTELVSKEF
jgi:hypothetical protein